MYVIYLLPQQYKNIRCVTKEMSDVWPFLPGCRLLSIWVDDSPGWSEAQHYCHKYIVHFWTPVYPYCGVQLYIVYLWTPLYPLCDEHWAPILLKAPCREVSHYQCFHLSYSSIVSLNRCFFV